MHFTGDHQGKNDMSYSEARRIQQPQNIPFTPTLEPGNGSGGLDGLGGGRLPK